ncbi:P-loop containing nucleoside triphosphate hydrolase protein, partial [Schizophyllum commune]
EKLREHPHDHQLDVVTHTLDRTDVLAITYTGSGKSGYIYMAVTIINAILEDPDICPTAIFPRSPLVLVICPTIALEEDLERKMKKYNIESLVISKARRDALRKRRIDIFEQAKTPSLRVLLLTPEMLSSDSFAALLNDSTFQTRPVALMVDEAHLMYTWGRQFRTEYLQIGNARDRFASRPALVAFTATLRKGPTPDTSPLHCVQRFLGFVPNQFHFVRRSCARYEMRFTVR